MGGATTSTRYRADPEVTANVPLPPFAVLIIGINALLLFGSPLLLIFEGYHGGGTFDAWFALACFALPLGICYTLSIHRRGTQMLLWSQCIALWLWPYDPGLFWGALATAIYTRLASVPQLYFQVVRRGHATPYEAAQLTRWPRPTLPLLDAFSVGVYWLVAFAALYLFAGLFIPGLLFSVP